MKNIIVYVLVFLFFAATLLLTEHNARAKIEDRVYLNKLIEHKDMKIYEFQHNKLRTCYIVRTKVMGGSAASMTCL